MALAVLLFAPDALVASLGAVRFRDENRLALGLGSLAIGSLLVARVLDLGRRWLVNHVRWWVKERGLRKRLRDLTPTEQRILRTYLVKDTRTLSFSVRDGTIAGLVQATILYRATSVGNVFDWAHNIQPWAWDYLRAHPELLGLARTDGGGFKAIPTTRAGASAAP